jgi:TPR repeat protein
MSYPKAYVSLGRCYMTGTGAHANIEKARGLFKEGGELGDLEARLEYIRSYIGVDLKE